MSWRLDSAQWTRLPQGGAFPGWEVPARWQNRILVALAVVFAVVFFR